MEDILLVKRAIKGDREAFEDLINISLINYIKKHI